MASQERPESTTIAWDALQERINSRLGVDFHQLIDMVRHLLQQDPGQGLAFDPLQNSIYHKSAAGLGFAPPGQYQITMAATGEPQMTSDLLALQGSNSPLPGHYLDALALEEAQQQEQHLGDFINLFNHRLIEMVHDIWRKNRYHRMFENEGTDDFSQKIFALVGLGNPAVRREFPIAHSKMLAYAGTLASPGRSPEVVCGLVMHCFDLVSVYIEMWQFRWVILRQEQYTLLGVDRNMGGNEHDELSVLGRNFLLGDRVRDASGKFILTLSKLTYEQFLSFLPDGENHAPLVTFISFILGDQLAWNLRLQLAEGEMRQTQLGDKTTSSLGYTFFIGKPVGEPSMMITIRK